MSDVWSEWLMHTRHADDPAYGRVVQTAVETYADRVLDGAKLGPGMTLVDVGAGEGLVAFRAIDRIGPSLHVILADVSVPMLRHAESLATSRKVRAQCIFLECSAESLPGIADASVDAVTTRAVIAYVNDKKAAFAEFFRKLKPGGRLSIAEPTKTRRADALDVLIVGAGPAGLAASLTAKKLGIRYITVEQEALGGAVFQYPRGKLVMTAPVELPLIGKVQFRNTSKEELLKFWNQACKENGLNIRYQERVESVERREGVFHVRTNRGEHVASTILLGIGRRGTPRKLGVPGEELSKVVYRLIDPEQYRRRRVMVVGGGDSALEAAASIAELGDAEVVLSYRGEAFQRAKPRNRQRVEEAVTRGQLKVMLNSQVKAIHADAVIVKHPGGELRQPNDAVIVSAGGILPNDFLKSIGIQVETKWGTA